MLAAAHPYGTRSRRAVPGVSPAGGAQVSRSDGHVLKLSSNLGQIRRELREALSRDCVGSGRSAKYHSESPCDEEQVCQRSFPPKSSPKAVMAGRSQDSSSQPLFCTLVRGRRTSVGTRHSRAAKSWAARHRRSACMRSEACRDFSERCAQSCSDSYDDTNSGEPHPTLPFNLPPPVALQEEQEEDTHRGATGLLAASGL